MRASVQPQLNPCVLHGSWIPDKTGGRFLVWGEEARRLRPSGGPDHPFGLGPEALLQSVRGAWIGRGRAANPEFRQAEAWITLPGTEGQPAPSLELQADLDDGVLPPDSWDCWRVWALRFDDPPGMLGHLTARDRSKGPIIHIGHDLKFWAQLARALQQAVRCHEFLPSMHATGVDPLIGKGRRRRKAHVDLAGGWELATSARERIAGTFVRAMPGACCALSTEPPQSTDGQPALPTPQTLVEHFLEVQLQAIVGRTPLTVKVREKFQNTFPGHALPKDARRELRLGPIGERTWGKWWNWRQRIQRSAAEADEQVCFRLADAPPDSPDEWRLEWLLSSHRDPSLLVPLAEFWSWDTASRTRRSVREVLLQLGQAARLYGELWKGMNSDLPSELVLNRDEALDFLRLRAPILQGAGFRVIVPSWWTSEGQRRLRARLTAQSSVSKGTGTDASGHLGLDSLLDFRAEVTLDGTPITGEEWERLVEAKQGLVALRGQWMELQAQEVPRLEEFWDRGEQLLSMTLQEALRVSAAPGGPEIGLDGETGQLFAGLVKNGSFEQLEQPVHFRGELRPYQLRGYSWLAYLESLGCGACLADDMGLGKTVQAIAAILGDRARHPVAGPTLLVAPTSVLGNWKREIGRFAPTLVSRLHHGPKRPRSSAAFQKALCGTDVVIASFGVARLDVNVLAAIRWRRLVVDECQNAKNPVAATTKALRRIRAECRIAMTGTPVENRLMDLWSVFSIINPGYLGTMSGFRRDFERPIARHHDAGATHQLRGIVQPFILRRMKTDKAIISDLPDKVEQNALCNLTPEQASLYEAVVRETSRKLQQSDVEGIRRKGIVLATLTRLKQICNHPAHFLQDGSAFSEARSHKLARVCEMLDEIEAEGECALVFTQFREVGKQLESLFRRRYGGAVFFLHGGTPRPRREYMVEEFQNPHSERGIFVLSLKAGGTGLTLTRANHVIHFDRWWNPAVEDQATDRAYRIGQEKCVMVHKMVTMGTLEERIDQLIESKKELAEGIVGSGESWLSTLDNATFRRLISLNRSDAVVG